jgi:preprotein translocase subunit SecB
MAKTTKAAVKKTAPKTNGDGAEPASPATVTPQAPPTVKVAPLTPLPGAAAAAAPAPGGQPAQKAPAPQMKILGQYLKDLSFENPHAPQSLGVQLGQQEVAISVNVNARTLAPTDFEVELHIEAKASQEAKPVFVAELLYAGIFRLENIPQESLHPIVLIECPRMLFPFARQILAEATRSGGFPPLYLDPIDFAGLYQKRAAQAKAQEPASAPPSASTKPQ